MTSIESSKLFMMLISTRPKKGTKMI